MGYRTVVILNNDMCSTWKNDADLGKKISHAMNCVGTYHAHIDNYGIVANCSHADTQYLAVIDSLGMDIQSTSFWFSNQSKEDRDLFLLREMAYKMGYRLTKLPKKDTENV